MKERKLRKPSHELMEKLAEYLQTEYTECEKLQITDKVYAEVLDETHVRITNLCEADEQKDTELVFCKPIKLPQMEEFEINTFEEKEIRRVKNAILLRYLFLDISVI